MSSRDFGVLLDDIREACRKVGAYRGDLSYERFAADSRTVDATLHNLQIIGEAAARLPDDVRARYPEIEWRDIVAFRNILVHEYFGVDLRIVWRIVIGKVPEPARRLDK